MAKPTATWQEIQQEKAKQREKKEKICTCPCSSCANGWHQSCIMKQYEIDDVCEK